MIPSRWLSFLQLISPTLPIGSYSYSEGIEWLVDSDQIKTPQDLEQWLSQELSFGSIRIEAAIMLRACQCVLGQDAGSLHRWNQWFLAARETAELRHQTCQMGHSLAQLLSVLKPDSQPWIQAVEGSCTLPIAFGIAVALMELPPDVALLGYLHSWCNNLLQAGIRLGLLGQTQGQLLLQQLQPGIQRCADEVKHLPDRGLNSFSLGLTLVSMAHENQYSRLFRS
jgi:urease accessory protein